MFTATNISKNFLKDKHYKVLILDVNSLFMFGSKNSLKAMYVYIMGIKKAINNDRLLVINVIDNGISQRVLRLFPDYKGNRPHSIQSNTSDLNKFGNGRSFKYKITRIHKLDGQFINHLTFYLPGEADFKVGWLLSYFNEHTNISPSEILTVSFDKDYILCKTLSDVILKRFINGKRYWCLLDNNADIETFKIIMKVENLKIFNIYDYFYYLIVNGDSLDNIKSLLTKEPTIKLLNNIIDIYGKLSIELICNHIGEYNKSVSKQDIYNNCYLIDLFNKDAFTDNQKNTMAYVMNNFLQRNFVEVY